LSATDVYLAAAGDTHESILYEAPGFKHSGTRRYLGK